MYPSRGDPCLQFFQPRRQRSHRRRLLGMSVVECHAFLDRGEQFRRQLDFRIAKLVDELGNELRLLRFRQPPHVGKFFEDHGGRLQLQCGDDNFTCREANRKLRYCRVTVSSRLKSARMRAVQAADSVSASGPARAFASSSPAAKRARWVFTNSRNAGSSSPRGPRERMRRYASAMRSSSVPSRAASVLPSACADSITTTSLSSVSAWSGVFETSRRAMHCSPVG